jgi:transposase-like protein
MTFYALADCCRLLDIDPKTLHRWLTQAQLPVHPHPRDGRKTSLSEEHLHQLACLHHRSLPARLDAPPSQPALSTPTELPAALLSLPEQLATLHAQLAALQHQVADLTLRLPPQPVSSAPVKTPSPRATPTKPTPPPKPAHVLPLVEATREGQYVVLCPKQGLLALQLDTPEWFTWLETQAAFRFVGSQGRMTVHRELSRLPNAAWRAHRKLRNHTHNLHLGHTQDLTSAVLEQAAATLDAHLQ